MIAYAPGDRVLVEDEHALYTGRIVDMFVLVTREGRVPIELGYAVALDGGGPVLVTTDGCLWPEGATPPPPGSDVEDVEDGSHEWITP